MKIDTGVQNYTTALDSARTISPAKPAEDSRQTRQPGKDAFSLDLSPQAQQTAAPDKVGQEARRAKLDAIREQLASGTYSISGRDVASKILSLLKG